MALINCKECGKEMSSTAKICPGCHYDREKVEQEKQSFTNVILMFIILIIVVFGSFFGLFDELIESLKFNN